MSLSSFILLTYERTDRRTEGRTNGLYFYSYVYRFLFFSIFLSSCASYVCVCLLLLSLLVMELVAGRIKDGKPAEYFVFGSSVGAWEHWSRRMNSVHSSGEKET